MRKIFLLLLLAIATPAFSAEDNSGMATSGKVEEVKKLVPAASVDKPGVFEIHVGGFTGPTWSLKLENDKITYIKRNSAEVSAPETIAVPDVKWKEFRNTLDQINVWEWKDSYFNKDVQDGTQWSLQVNYSDKSIQASGSNAFPGADGKSNNSPQFSEQFNKLLKALSELTGKDIK